MAFSSRSLVTEKPHFTVTFSWKWNLCWDLGLGTMLVTQKLQQLRSCSKASGSDMSHLQELMEIVSGPEGWFCRRATEVAGQLSREELGTVDLGKK